MKKTYIGKCEHINNACITDKEKKRAYDKAHREANKERILAREKAYREANKEKIKARREANKEKMKSYREANKERISAKNKAYREANKKKIKAYLEANKESILAKGNAYRKLRYNTDHLFKIKSTLRNRTSNAFKNNGYEKSSTTEKMLGTTYEIAKQHIERQFTKGMNWNNYGEWHIDHIMPLASANTEAELIKLCHYRNLQPLWAFDNISKGSTIPKVQLQMKI